MRLSRSCRSLVRDHLATHAVPRTWDDVLRPVLAAVGERWADLPHGVAVEHVLSHVAAAALGATIAPRPPEPPTVLLACVPVEEHDLPLVALSAALLPELADPGVLGALPPTGCLVAAGPGWDGATLPDGVRRVDDLPGAVQIVDEALGFSKTGTKGRRRSAGRR